MITRALLLLSLAAGGASLAHAADPELQALNRLQQTAPQQIWQAQRPLQVDIDCDGRPDFVFLSQTRQQAMVGIVFGNRRLPVFTQSIAIGDPQQDSLCDGPAEIASDSLRELPPDGAPGYRTSKTCRAFRLVGGECDAFHFYWDASNKRPAWWRL